MQWDENLFSVENRGEDKGYFINHSCEPNIGFRGQINGYWSSAIGSARVTELA